jgi:hypothetical protein
MLTHPTIDQLRTLKLDGMADAFIELQAQDKARDLAHAEWLALLLDSRVGKPLDPTLPNPVACSPAASQPEGPARDAEWPALALLPAILLLHAAISETRSLLFPA